MPPTPPNLSTLAARLKWLRAQVNLTQAEFAALCSVTKSYVSRLESGQRPSPSANLLQTCAAALGVPAAWLARGTGPLPTPALRPTSTAPAPSTSEPDLQTLFRLLFQAVPVDADLLLRLSASILDSPKLTNPFKQAAVFAAHLAFHDSKRRP